ncbi:MAG TPA: cohesin domain-containing protein [Bryobacteraceae bacterium]|jgi:general secretion pathway protein D|nr:cohesin domain-containing protein [Bryobacteraceae bacterium]
MSFFNSLTRVVLVAALAAPMAPLQARTRKGDKYLAEGRAHEDKKDWDAALESYDKALAEDPGELVYQMASQKARFQAGQAHIDRGLKIRSSGQLGEALLEFQKAYAIDPSSSVAVQELQRTQEMIQRERKRVQETGKETPPEQRGLTPIEEMKKQTEEKTKRILGVPELKPLDPSVRNISFNGQSVKTLFETLGKVAGINVLWDPDYTNPTKNTFTVHFENETLEAALDHLAVITKSYWKALSPNTIFITNDNPTKRRDFVELVAQTFYLSNVSLPQEIQEIVNAVRSVSELQRVVAFNSQNAIIVRGESDQVALAAKMIHDLDRPKPEVVIDIMVMEASTVFSRQLTAAVASQGLTVPFTWTPRNSVTTTNSGSGSGTPSTPGSGSGGTPTSSSTSVSLNNLGISTSDVAISVPSALLQAVLSDTKTKTLQAPEIRTLEGIKAEIKIGEREPTATGSFQPGIGGVGINPLVNTQFTYIDVGVNVTLQARVHDNGDVGIHIDLDVSTVAGHVNLGGIDQPIIGQRKISQEIRMHQGEVGLLGGLINTQDTKQITGIPGLSSIPFLGKLFSGQSVDRQRGELMIAIIPHVIRRAEVTAENLRPIAVGNATIIKLGYAPKETEQVDSKGAAAPAQPLPGTVTPPAVPGTVAPGTSVAAGTPTTAPSTAPAAAPGLAPPATAPPATASPAGADSTQKPGARVHFSPSQQDTSQSSNFMVALSLEGGTDVAAAPLQIQFDPKILQLNGVARGDFFSSDGQMPVFTWNILNESGAATIQLNRLPGTPGVNGSGVLITLNFQAVGKGSTTVTIPNLSVRSSQGQVLATGSPQLVVNVK